MAKERLHYIDVAKGLLILMVVWGHYELMCRLCFGIKDPTIDLLDCAEDVWVAFFMPAFFYLSGYCTNFTKSFGSFFVRGVKILIIPAVIINYTADVFEYISWGEGIPWIVKTITKSFLLTCANEWFIPSLFISRLIVWALLRMKNCTDQFAISLILFCLGILLYDSYPELPDIWSYKHAFMMVIFMLTGFYMKKRQWQVKWPFYWSYPVLLTVMLVLGLGIPYITNRVNVELWQMPILLILAFTGTFFIIYLSKKIGKNSVLEYLGRNSLVIYLAHFIFYKIYIGMASEWFDISPFISVCLFFGIIILNVASCCILAEILNTRYFKWILGKF